MANMPLTDIGITPRKASQFASKGIETVTDLLGYYPTKYLDFRNPISYAEGKYHQGEHVAIKGKVVSGRVIDGKHYMLRLTDGNTFCTVFWFNQPFRTRQFSVGDVIALGGVVSWNEQYNNMTMATPDFVTTDIASAFSIQPVYRKIKGMSVEYLEDAIKLAMPYTRECSTETLSLAQMRALRVPPIAEAIHMAHQPTDEKEIRLSRKRRAVDVLYPFCYELEAKKAEAAKVSFCRIKSTRDVLNKMQGVLPFKLTEDQKNAAEHMLTEMEHGERVDTLVQGDVGCGKTVVAEICALAMAMNGFQCAVMAPTVVLATQHYEEFSKILGSFGYKTVFLRSGMKAKEEKSVLEEIESGKAQIIVGTHSVISGKVKYHKLGLTIVDEEHRFGVEQREALKQKAKDGVHNVSMSATPIPRSLANTLYVRISPDGLKYIRSTQKDALDVDKRAAMKRRIKGEQGRLTRVETTLCMCRAAGIQPAKEASIKLIDVLDPEQDAAQTFMNDFFYDKGLLFLSDEISATIKTSTTMGEEYTLGQSRLVGIVINRTGISFLYCTLDKLMRWVVSYEQRRVSAVMELLKSSSLAATDEDFATICNMSPKCIVIGKTCAIVPKIITGDKYGKAIDSTDIIKTHNATRLLTLTNLEQVYKYSYFVPTSSIGVELLTRTAALTRNELNEMISVWLDEMAESHTTVTTGRYVEAYINEQKCKTITLPVIEFEELEYQKNGRVPYHVVCERGTQDGISRALGSKVLDFKDFDNIPMPAHKYDDDGIRRDGINPLTHNGYNEEEMDDQ